MFLLLTGTVTVIVIKDYTCYSDFNIKKKTYRKHNNYKPSRIRFHSNVYMLFNPLTSNEMSSNGLSSTCKTFDDMNWYAIALKSILRYQLTLHSMMWHWYWHWKLQRLSSILTIFLASLYNCSKLALFGWFLFIKDEPIIKI